MSPIALNIAAFFTALVAMEALAWWTHRYVMHGPLWSWHRSHHEERRGLFELNDLFAVVFAGVALAAFWLGAQPGWSPLWWAAAGATAYGLLYALAHDALVHQRWGFRYVPKRGYLKRLVQSHRLHHATAARDGAVSFGFLFAPDPRRLAAELKRRREGVG